MKYRYRPSINVYSQGFPSLYFSVVDRNTVLKEIKNLSVNKAQPPEVFCRKRCPKNFQKFPGKHLGQRLFLNKVAGVRTPPDDCF